MHLLVALLCAALFVTTSADAQKKTAPSLQKKKRMMAVDTTRSLVVIQTSMGDITIQLFDDKCPKHAANFRKLAREGFYAGTTFHRVIPGFMIQGGDPNSRDDDPSNDGLGGPGYQVEAEIGVTHDRGIIAAARQSDFVNPKRSSNGSQFYITVADAKYLDGQYSVFGKVVAGMDVADKIAAVPRDQRDSPLQKVVITKVVVKE